MFGRKQLNLIKYGKSPIKSSEFLSRSADLSLSFCFNVRFPPSKWLYVCRLSVLVVLFFQKRELHFIPLDLVLLIPLFSLWLCLHPGIIYGLTIHHSLRWCAHQGLNVNKRVITDDSNGDFCSFLTHRAVDHCVVNDANLVVFIIEVTKKITYSGSYNQHTDSLAWCVLDHLFQFCCKLCKSITYCIINITFFTLFSQR